MSTKKSCRGGAAKAIQNEIIKGVLKKIRYTLLVTSGKGGVGKSTVAVNLAEAFHSEGYKVGLLDADLHGPSIPRLLGLVSENAAIHEDRSMDPVKIDDSFEFMSVESLLREKDTSVVWKGPLKTNMIRQFLSDVAWGDLDFLIVDSPPGTGDEPLTVAKTVPEAFAVIVTTPQEASLADVRKSLNFCRQLDIEIAGIVENMSGLMCPHCSGSIEVFKTGGGRKLASEENVSFLGPIPIDPEMVRAGDEGTWFMKKQPTSETAQAVRAIAGRIMDGLKSKRPREDADA